MVQKNEIINETDEMLVQGQLEVDGIVKCQFDTSRITRNRRCGEMVSPYLYEVWIYQIYT